MTIVDRAAALGLFIGCVLLVCVFALAISGMFPAELRPRGLRGAAGTAALYASVAVVVLLIPHTIMFAASRIAWYFAVIAAGLTFLASPFVHAALPAPVRDGAAGVGVLAVAGIALHLGLLIG